MNALGETLTRTSRMINQSYSHDYQYFINSSSLQIQFFFCRNVLQYKMIVMIIMTTLYFLQIEGKNMSNYNQSQTSRFAKTYKKEQSQYQNTFHVAQNEQKSSLGGDKMQKKPEQAEYLQVTVTPNGERIFKNTKGEVKKIFPYPDSYFSFDPQFFNPGPAKDFTKQKESNQSLFKCPVNSPVYNYQVLDIFNLAKAYDGEIQVEKKKQMYNNRRKARRNFILAKNLTLIGLVYHLTSFRKKWFRLTSNKLLGFNFLFTCSAAWGISGLHYDYMQFTQILTYHTEFQKVIRRYEKDEKLI